jgi:hypothetical protein
VALVVVVVVVVVLVVVVGVVVVVVVVVMVVVVMCTLLLTTHAYTRTHLHYYHYYHHHQTTTTPVLRLAADPSVRMGFRATTTGGSLGGLQVWARELSDGSRLVGLLNGGDGGGGVPPDNCTWEHRIGGYYQV